MHVERRPTTGPGSATLLAAEAAKDAELVVVAGGDGSIRETLIGLGESAARIPIGVIPCGNANVVARDLGIPLAGDGAFDLLTSGEKKAVDVGYIGDDLFLAMVGIGWDARTTANLAALRRTRLGARWYARWADSAYVACGLAALFTWPPGRLQLEVDGHMLEERPCAAIIANQATYGKSWSLVPQARFDDGKLHYQARRRFGFPFVAVQLLAGMLRRPAPRLVSSYGAGTRIVVRANRPVPVHVDGDFRGFETAFEVRVLASAARILVPRTAAGAAELQQAGRP